MPLKAVDENVIIGVADALREADGNPSAKYKPANFPAAVRRVSELGGFHDITFRNAVGNIPRRTFVSEISNFELGDVYEEPNSKNPKRENIQAGHVLAAKLTNTKFIMVYKQQTEIRAVIGTINENAIQYEVPHVIQRIGSDGAPQDYFAKVSSMNIATLSPTRVVISFCSTATGSGYTHGQLKTFMALNINGNVIQEETGLVSIHEYGNHTSLLPVAEDTLLVITYDSTHGTLFMLKVAGSNISYDKNRVDLGGGADWYNNYSMTLLSDSTVAIAVASGSQVVIHPYVINEEGIVKKTNSVTFDLAGAAVVITALIDENKFLLCAGAQGKIYARTVTVAQNITLGKMDSNLTTGVWCQFSLVRINPYSFVLGMFADVTQNTGYETATVGLEIHEDNIEPTLEQSHFGTCFGVLEHISGNKVLMCYNIIDNGAIVGTILGVRSGVTIANGSKPIFGLTTKAASDGEWATIAVPREASP